ncbi:HWE histidine kinase domain-containing protein [Methylobacterium oryzae CBMB20]
MFIDVSDRKQAEARRAALAELGDRLRNTADKAEIARVASEILGRTLGLSHAGYGAVDHDRETILVGQGWSAPGIPGIGGLHGFRNYGSYIESLKAAHAVIIDDVADDPRTAPDAGALQAIHVRALLNLPIMEHGRFVALLFALKDVAYAWKPEEIGFASNIADRTRAALARIEAEEQQRTLNLELSHRMKNMLAMVQSIATQTMRTATDLDAAKDVLAGRLIALSKSHDLLLGGTVGSALRRDRDQERPAVPRGRPGPFRPGGTLLHGRLQGGAVAVPDAARTRDQRGQVRRAVDRGGHGVRGVAYPGGRRGAAMHPPLVGTRRSRRRGAHADRVRVPADRARARREFQRRRRAHLSAHGGRMHGRRTARGAAGRGHAGRLPLAR